MRVAAKKIRRPRIPGEIVIEQSRDAALLARMLGAAAMTTAGIDAPGGCFLAAFDGAEAAGVIGVETRVDAALLRSLYVREPLRRRGIGAALVAAARLAAHTRGARRLYAIARADAARDWFFKRGFSSASAASILAAMAGTPYREYLTANCDPAGLSGFALDISNDGVIER